MWHAIKERKVERVLGLHNPRAPAAWRRTLNHSEDLLASGVLERLSYLPGAQAIEVVLRAAEVKTARWVPIPEPVLQSLPWPHPSDDERIEPDWIWVAESYIIVFEAKWGVGVVPAVAQLRDQARVCSAKWPERRTLQVALIQSGVVDFPPEIDGVVVTWSALRQQALRRLQKEREPALRRVLDDIRDILDGRGLALVFMGSLSAVPVEGHLEPFSELQLLPEPLPALLAMDLPAITFSW